MSIEDTGNRRRRIDGVSTDQALELVCTLAYEKAVSGGDDAVIYQVELAILALRQLKEDTVSIPTLDPDNLPRMLRGQAD